jgi:hypothetical protein
MKDKIAIARAVRAQMVRPNASWHAPTIASVKSAAKERGRSGIMPDISAAAAIEGARAQRAAMTESRGG